MLSDLSHRHMSLVQLAASSGMRRGEVQQFLEMLDSRGVLAERDLFGSDSMFDSLRPLGGWLRRPFSTSATEKM